MNEDEIIKILMREWTYQNCEVIGDNSIISFTYKAFDIERILEFISSRKCSNCLYYGLGNCELLREFELKSGICGDGWVEIDNPEEHYCADFEARIK